MQANHTAQSKRSPYPSGWKLILDTWSMARDYGKLTTIHGLNRIFESGLSRKQRLLWTLIFVTAVIMVIMLCFSLAARFNSKQLQTVVTSTKYRIYRIPFPEIIICNSKLLNFQRLQEVKSKYLLQKHQIPPYTTVFEKILRQISKAKYETLDDMADQAALEELNYVTLREVVKDMSWRCNEVLIDCEWQRKPYNCCEIFLPRYNKIGLCLSFNNVVTPGGKAKQEIDPMWPWHTDMHGFGSGLNFKMLTHENSLDDRKVENFIKVVVVEPQVWDYQNFEVMPNTSNTVSIRATLNIYDKNTRYLSPHERHCLFDDEVHSSAYKTFDNLKYMLENCFGRCHQQYITELRNCTPNQMFPQNGHHFCTIKDFNLLADYITVNKFLKHARRGQAEHKSENNLLCNCLLSCRSLKYVLNHNQLAIPHSKRLDNESFVLFKFFYDDEFAYLQRTTLIHTWVDLLASFGGIFVLFLGGSVISVMEPIYFLLIRLPLWLKERRSKKLQQMEISKLHDEAPQMFYW